MVDKNGRWLHKNSNKSDISFPMVYSLQMCESTNKYDRGWDVDEVFGDESGCSHVDLEEMIFISTRGEQCEPRGIDQSTTI